MVAGAVPEAVPEAATILETTAAPATFETGVAFPRWPVGWYTVARSRDVASRQIVPLELAGAEIVLFRTTAGQLHAVGAHCPHMGTHLRHGQVLGEELRCPMHHWRVDGAGTARAGGRVCARVRTWPVEERYGLVFVHLGGKATAARRCPLPAPQQPDDYAWRSDGPVVVETSWPTLMVSGFDMEHLHTVHHRQLQAPPAIEEIDGRLRLRYVSKVSGGNLADRVMGWLGRDGIEVTMTCTGPVFVVETRMGRRRTSAILGLLSRGSAVHAYGSFGVPRQSWGGAAQLRLASWLFVAFLRKDFAIIEGMRLRTDVRDAGVQAMCRFLASLEEVADV